MKSTDNRTALLLKSIQNDIISGNLKPGDKLLPLRDMALKYKVSRSVVNSAVSALSTKGYIRIVPRHFAEVNDFLAMGSLTVLEDIFNSKNEPLKHRLINDTLACRMLVETDCVRKIAENPAMDLSLLMALVANEGAWRMDPKRDLKKLYAMDLAFHSALIRLGDNLVFGLIYQSLDYLAKRMVETFYANPQVVDFVFEKHEQIYRALHIRDQKAAVRLIQELLKHGENELFKSV
jgi:GntR family transcriptional repressor for pyruvate dehydrogenase complex